jgi:hypothetical protein
MFNSKRFVSAVLFFCAAVMAAGCGSSVISPEDVTEAPLLPPTTVVAKRASESSILIMWDLSTQSHLQGYNVYRANAGSDTFTKLNSNVVLTNQFLDATPELGVRYEYRVRPISKKNSEGGYAGVEIYNGSTKGKDIFPE